MKKLKHEHYFVETSEKYCYYFSDYYVVTFLIALFKIPSCKSTEVHMMVFDVYIDYDKLCNW